VKKLDILTDADTYRFLSKSTIHLIHLRVTALGTVSRMSCMMLGNVCLLICEVISQQRFRLTFLIK